MTRLHPARLNPSALFAGLCLLILCAVLIPRGDSYWNFSDGVYLYSSRDLLHGGDLYSGFAAAQPPPLYYAGAGILALCDSIAGARIGLAAINVLTALTVMIAVRRLTGRARLAAVAGALALLTPRALHDTAQLLPETFAAPLVMAAALAASRRASSALGGALAVLAAAFKLAFVLPLAAIALAAASVRRYLAGAAASAIVLGAVFLIAFGAEMTDSVIGDQRSLGFTELSKLPSLLAQAGWNLLPFSLPVLAAWVYRERSRDPQLMRTLAMAALGSLAVFVSIVKYGTYINLAVVAEPPLLALGAAGASWAWDAREELARRSRNWIRGRSRGGRPRRPPGPDADRRAERPVPLHPAAGAGRRRLGPLPRRRRPRGRASRPVPSGRRVFRRPLPRLRRRPAHARRPGRHVHHHRRRQHPLPCPRRGRATGLSRPASVHAQLGDPRPALAARPARPHPSAVRPQPEARSSQRALAIRQPSLVRTSCRYS